MKLALIAAIGVLCCGPRARAEDRQEDTSSCPAHDVFEVETALGKAPLLRHCLAMQARFADLDLTYGELMYRHAKQRRDLGIAMMAVVAPAFGAAFVGLGIASYRSRKASEESNGADPAPRTAGIVLLHYETGMALLGIVAGVSLLGGFMMVVSGAERMRLLEPLLTSDPSTWKKRGGSVDISLVPRLSYSQREVSLFISWTAFPPSG